MLLLITTAGPAPGLARAEEELVVGVDAGAPGAENGRPAIVAVVAGPSSALPSRAGGRRAADGV